MKIKISIALFFLTIGFVQAQSGLPQNTLDSLWKIWTDQSQHDTVRLESIKKIAWEGYLFSLPDSAFALSQLQYDFALNKKLKKYQADALNTQGATYFIKTDYAKSIEYHTRSLKIREEINDQKGIAASLGNIGNIIKDQGDATTDIVEKNKYYNKAIEYHNKSLLIKQKNNDLQGIAASLSNLGIVFRSKGFINSDKEQKNTFYLKALDCQEKSLAINQSIGNQRSISNSLNNIGLIYTEMGEYETNLSKKNEYYKKSIESYFKSLEIQQKFNNQQGVARSLVNIGTMHYAQAKAASNPKEKNKLLQKVIEDNSQALKIAQKRGFPREIEGSSNLLYLSYKLLKQHHLALQMHELYSITKDSIRSVENQNEVIRQELKYEYDKKAATDSIANEKEKQIKDIEIEKQQTEIKAKRNQQYGLYGGLLLVIFFSIVIYNRLQITKRQKVIIEKQKEIVEEKQKEIIDSIRYARKIQDATITQISYIERNINRLKNN